MKKTNRDNKMELSNFQNLFPKKLLSAAVAMEEKHHKSSLPYEVINPEEREPAKVEVEVPETNKDFVPQPPEKARVEQYLGISLPKTQRDLDEKVKELVLSILETYGVNHAWIKVDKDWITFQEIDEDGEALEISSSDDEYEEDEDDETNESDESGSDQKGEAFLQVLRPEQDQGKLDFKNSPSNPFASELNKIEKDLPTVLTRSQVFFTQLKNGFELVSISGSRLWVDFEKLKIGMHEILDFPFREDWSKTKCLFEYCKKNKTSRAKLGMANWGESLRVDP